MQILFWLSVFSVFFIYFIFPVILLILSKFRGSEPEQKEITPFITLIVPMHNEERVVPDKVQNIFSLDYPQDKMEVIFALDGCSDRTKDMLLQYREKRIIILDYPDRAGKVATLNKTVLEAQGEIIVFSDANSIYNKDALRKLVRNFADAKVGCVSGRLAYIKADANLVGRGENLYWKYDMFVKRQESRLGRLLITNGSMQAVRKSIYPFPDPEVADDFSIPLLIQAAGYKILFEPEAVVYEVATQSLKEDYNQRVRILAQGLKGIIRLRKELVKLGPLGLFLLLFHKILRWQIIFFQIVIFISNLMLIQNRFYFNLFLLQILFYFLASVGLIFRNKFKTKIFSVPFFFCLINFSFLAAIFRLFKNSQTSIWDKAHSTRLKNAEKLKVEGYV